MNNEQQGKKEAASIVMTNIIEYRAVVEKAKIEDEKNRYENFKDRKDNGVYTMDTWKSVSHGKYRTHWRGVQLMKDPFDVVIYQELLFDVKPATIIEFGAYSGGSALWMADVLKVYGSPTHVYSVDIDLNWLEPLAKESRDDVTFIQGDSNEVEKVFPAEKLKEFPHPWVVVEDAHVNLVGVLEHLDSYTQPGDYFIIEDTNPKMNAKAGQGAFEGLEFVPSGTTKLNQLKEFMEKRSSRYLVDKHYNDLFGYNGTLNLNGFLKRI